MSVELNDPGPVEAVLRVRVEQLASLSRLSESVARAESPEHACDAALDFVAETLAPDRAAVLLLDGGIMRFKAWRGLSDDYRRATEGHSPWTDETAHPEPVLVEDVAVDPELAELRAVIEAEGIGSLAFFPLVARGRLLGKFMVYFDRPHAFSPTEVRLGQAIGSHIAIEIARRQAAARTHRNGTALGTESRAEFIDEATQLLSRSLDPRATLHRIADLAVGHLADACVVDLMGDGYLEQLAVAGGPSGSQVLFEGRERLDEEAQTDTAAGRVIASGEPELLETLAGELPIGAARNERLQEALASIGPRSAMVVPLHARGRTFGALTFVAGEGRRPYREADLDLARDLARRAAIAADNGLLHEAEQHARATAERLQTVTESLARSLTMAEIGETIVHEGAAALGAAAGWLAAVDRERRELRRLASVGYQEELDAAYSTLPLSLDNPTVDAVRQNRVLWLESCEEVVAAYPALDDDYRKTGFEAMAIVPLPAAGGAAGVIALNFTEPRSFRHDERRVLVALAAQCGQAIERANLYAELQGRADAASVLAHVGDGVFQLDLDDRVVLWNRGAEVITGLSETETMGKRVEDIFLGWEEMKPRISITDLPLAFGRREAVPVTLMGRRLWLAISGVETGEGIVYAFRDVTESERLEKTRRDFLATASHELRTPLAGVFGATKTLLHRKPDAETSRALLEVIDRESERLASILDEILFASRADTGRIRMEIESCDIAAVAGDAIELQRTRVPPGITFSLEAEDGAPRAACDPTRLRQVLLNLLDNAVKYSPQGGTIAVTIRAHGDVLHLAVADEGLGVPPAESERIFEKFYRLDPELSLGVGGTGLGLFISREFVTRMNGRIWVDSLGEKGSTFVVELPAAS
ncbi:MAG TPA: GAF domain-containing protein [Gaiellaceae bacterium]